MGKGEMYACLAKKLAGKRPLGKHEHTWEDNIKIDLQGTGWGVLTGLIWLRTGTGDHLCQHTNEFRCSIKGSEFLG